MDKTLIVIGSGPGGYVAAIRAAQLGFNVKLIEKENLGGVCLNWGCIPTKALLTSASFWEKIQHAEAYGIEAHGQIQFDKIIHRSRLVADKMSKGVQFLMRKNKITVIEGTAALLPDKSVEVTFADGKKEKHTAAHILIATGARPRELPHIKIDGKNILGYREAMTLSEKPKTLLVIGAGAIGVEFSYFYQTIGTQVTLVEALPQILPLEDSEIAAGLEKILRRKGVQIFTQSTVEKVDVTKKEIKVTLQTPQGTQNLTAEKVLLAIGITPNIENLGLEALGIKLTHGRIDVDTFYQTNVPGIYAIGDVIATPALAHVASWEGILCVEKIAGLSPQPLDYTSVPSCIYTTPEIASVGLTERAAREKGYAIRVGKFPYTASGKATASGKNEGLVKLIFDEKYDELLGAHLLGENATEMIAELVTARKLESTGHEIARTMHPHPTLSEAIMEAAAAAHNEVIHL
ncbi:MAG: dihydrolipoyl dehydrogenase [Bacteroidia bacterium]